MELDLDNADLVEGLALSVFERGLDNLSDSNVTPTAILERLRFLTLRSCSVPLHPLLTPNLLRVKMYDVQLDTAAAAAAAAVGTSLRGDPIRQSSHIVQMVMACPRLQVLCLERIFNPNCGVLYAGGGNKNELAQMVRTLASTLNTLYLDLGSAVSANEIQSLTELRNLSELGLTLSTCNVSVTVR